MPQKVEFETVAIPVVRGLDITTRARLVQAPSLLQAQNSRFPRGSGSAKRRGHNARDVLGTKAIPPGFSPPAYGSSTPIFNGTYSTANRNIPSTWLFGWGPLVTNYDPVDFYATGTPFETSQSPHAGLLFGSANRDNETVVWNGHQLLSRTPGQIDGAPFGVTGSAVMPVLRSFPVAKNARQQVQPDVADTGNVKLVAWLDTTISSDVVYTILDSTTLAVMVPATSLGFSTAVQVKCLVMGSWMHMFIASTADNLLHHVAINDESPQTIIRNTLGGCTNYFSFWKASESSFVLLRNIDTFNLGMSWHLADASIDPTMPIPSNPVANFVPGTLIDTCAISVHPTTGNVGIVVRSSSFVAVGVPCTATFTPAGIATTGVAALSSVSQNYGRPVSIAPRYLTDSGNLELWDVFFDIYNPGQPTELISNYYDTGFGEVRYNLLLASDAFRVGNRTFIWAANYSALQSTWLLLDTKLNPVGKVEWATANAPQPTSFPFLTSINWRGPSVPLKDLFVFHCALGYKVRVAAETTKAATNAPAVYTEPAIKFLDLDFLPPLRGVQAGRCTHFAGAQVWTYDGTALTENGFHLAPENVVITQHTGGNLTALGTYTWRVDLCHRNAQNEEVRSLSFFTPQVTLTSGNQQVVLTIPSVITTRPDSYFLVFRNDSSGTLWYLINSRQPGNGLFLSNNRYVSVVDLTDDGFGTPADGVALESRELHPGNVGPNYLDPLTAPACEVISAGHDRLWVTGGEIGPGQVFPSRLFNPGESPAFHPDLLIQVDRSVEAITAIGFVGEVAAFFRRNNIYILDGDGPDNVLNGQWPSPRLAFADAGAISQESLGLITEGLMYQTPVGIRLLTPSGQVQDQIGKPTDELAKTLSIAACTVIGEDQEIRWYDRNGTTLVYNHLYNIWSTWTISAVGATRNPITNLALVARPDGFLWEEVDGLWLDDDDPYIHRIQFSWLRAGDIMDFQRVRRIGALGEWDGVTPHNVHVDVYYDERPFAEEWYDWSYPDTNSNQDFFGSDTFGAGNFGDDGGNIPFPDQLWRWRRRLYKQKCSVISVAIDDRGSSGEGFVLNALALELGRKTGLDRTPWSGGTITNTSGTTSSPTG